MNSESMSASMRALGTGVNPLNAPKFLDQFGRTLFPSKEDYPQEAGREALIIAPGLSYSPRTYHEAARYFSDDFNVLEDTDYSTRVKALLNGTGIRSEAERLLEVADQSDAEKVHFVGHSKGGLSAALADILDRERNVLRRKRGKTVTVSTPVNGSNLSQAVGLNLFESVRDFDPEGEIIRRLQAEGHIDLNVVSQRDELLTQAEMVAPEGMADKELYFPYGHFALIKNPVKLANDVLIEVKSTLQQA